MTFIETSRFKTSRFKTSRFKTWRFKTWRFKTWRFKTWRSKPQTAARAPVIVLGDADLVHVSGGFCGFYIKGPTGPTKTTGNGGGLKLDGVAGESMDSSHKDWIDI